jgi:hypothetical protein
MFIQFQPDSTLGNCSWAAHKVGEWVSVNAGDVLDGGSKHLHGVDMGGIEAKCPSKEMSTATMSVVAMDGTLIR